MAQFPGLSLTLQGNKMILKSSTGKVDDSVLLTIPLKKSAHSKILCS